MRDYLQLVGRAVGVVLVGFAEGLGAAKRYASRAGYGGAGAKSQVSGLVVAVLSVVTLLLLTGLFEQLPEAKLAAV